MTTLIVTTAETVVIQANYMHRHLTPAGMLTDHDALIALVAYYHADVLIVGREPLEGEPSEDSGWGTIHDPKIPAGYLHIGYLPRLHTSDMLLRHVAGDHASRLLVDDDTDDGCLSIVTGRLRIWRELTGVDYHTHPAVSAIVSMKRHVHRKPKWMLRTVAGEWWRPPAPITDIRTNSVLETGRQYVTWDRRAPSLPSAAAVDLPYKQLPHTGYDYDPLCGYYRVSLDNSPLGVYFRALLSQTADAAGDGTVWVCHPTLRVLQQTHTLVQVVDSYSTEERMRILRPWAEKWRDALTVTRGNGLGYIPAAEGVDLSEVLKRGYAQALGGLLDVKAGTIYRPDWRHMIIDHNRAHILRITARVWDACKILPADINVDAITYYCENPDGPTDHLDTLIGVGPLIGNMKTATVGTVAAQLIAKV